jgi:RimJ/RimL family protein N-acetyltransferase
MRPVYIRSNQHIGVRPLTTSDTDALFSAVTQSIDSLSRWMPWCKTDYTREDAASWTAFSEEAWNANKEFPMGIFDLADGQFVGCTGINQISRVNGIGNIGYWVSTPYRGRGYATTAALMSADFAFSELGLTRGEIVVLVENAVSHRVAENSGATKEGVARNRLYSHGKPSYAVVYSLIPQDLLKNEYVRRFTKFISD